jgi:DNA primase
MVDRALTLEEFKARLPLVEIIGRHVRLTRRGREWQGLCPFHREKTPSFTVSEAKGFYHCFGCGQHGTAIDFVMAIEGVDFGQAVQRLAELFGLPAPRGGDGKPRVDQSIYAANQAAARWFAGRLQAREGQPGAEYLAARGLDHAIIERFGLGYAPGERAALKRAMLAEGYTEAQLLEAGLLVQPDDGGASFDRFRDRVMFPIQDQRGRVVGFGGRTLGEARAKYLNTPETTAFHKGELLYGLPLARAAIRERSAVIVVEGYMDVIALAQAGFAHAVAPLGTAIGEAQLAQLWQFADEPLICLDGDEAGLRAGAAPGQVAALCDPAAGAGSRRGAARPQRGVPAGAGAPAHPRRGDPAPGFSVGARERHPLAHGAAAALGPGAAVSNSGRQYARARARRSAAQRFLQAIEGASAGRGCAGDGPRRLVRAGG